MMKRLPSLMLCVLSTSLYAAEHNDFGRLFSRASERSYLDKLRQKQQLTAAPAVAELQQPISLHGYVKRNDGKKSTLWINNQAVQEESTLGNVYIGRLNQLSLTPGANQKLESVGVDVSLSANAQTIRLQAGQIYTHAGQKIEALPGKEKSKSLDLAGTDAIIAHDKKSTQ